MAPTGQVATQAGSMQWLQASDRWKKPGLEPFSLTKLLTRRTVSYTHLILLLALYPVALLPHELPDGGERQVQGLSLIHICCRR